MKLGIPAGCILLAFAVPCAGQQQLPTPQDAPLEIDFSQDPVLALSRNEADEAGFHEAIAAAVRANPATTQSLALKDEAAAGVAEAREYLGPTVDLSLQAYRVIARDFDESDPDNLVERSRPLQRTDAILQAEQRLIDFGANRARVRRAEALEAAAEADVEGLTSDIALRFIAVWYEVFGYRALLEVVGAFAESEPAVRAAVDRRIAQGASARVDVARLDSLFADAEARRARFARLLASAEANYLAYAAMKPPPGLQRAPAPDLSDFWRIPELVDVRANAAVRAAESREEAAREEAIAAEADTMPSLSLGLDAGRYGVFERDRDYDIRARLTLSYRLFGGGGDPRAAQAQARARAAEAEADRLRIEAGRDVAIAVADLDALEDQLEALEQAYRAARISRDATIARFIAARGDVFEVAQAERSFVDAATLYIQGLIELDTTRYVVLARSGDLLAELGIDPREMNQVLELRDGG